jgi:tRNA modification GTPase
LSEQLRAIRAPLVALHADLEAALDFPEESEGAEIESAARLETALSGLRSLRDQGRRGAVIRRGVQVVLYGPVNSGKSTLFNRLLGAERAIVDEAPGTTRDALEARLEWDGLQVTLVDTAGLRASPERLEARGIERTRQALKSADLAVLLLPPSAAQSEVAQWRLEAADAHRLEVYGKADLQPAPDGALAVSGQTGTGVDALRSKILGAVGYRRAEAVALSSARHLEAIDRAVEALERGLAAQRSSTLEVVAGETGIALQVLSEITGEDARTELLDAIFQRFCIGK